MLLTRTGKAYIAITLMLVIFFQAARLALVVFDPYLSSYAIAAKLNHLPKGLVVVAGKYNWFSSVSFYSENHALQNGPNLDILEYGSLAPGAPRILVTDSELKGMWESSRRVYLIAKTPQLPHLQAVLGGLRQNIILQSADKSLFNNHPNH